MTYLHALIGPTAVHAPPRVRRITWSDLKEAIARGLDDFAEVPSHAVFLCVIYPVVGLLLGWLTFGAGLTSLVYPMIAGFALLGPFAAIGIYELSRRREAGLETDWTHAFDVFRSPSFGAIATLGILLMLIFLLWLATAQALYVGYFGTAPAPSFGAFIERIVTTREGWSLIILGNAIGFLFALLVLSISVVSFALLLDRHDVGAAEAVMTSIRVMQKNPVIMAAWGLIVAAALVIGSLPFLVGLAVVMPILGHITWHIYRKTVAPDPHAHEELPPLPEKHRRHYAAQFPASLFAGEPRRDE